MIDWRHLLGGGKRADTALLALGLPVLVGLISLTGVVSRGDTVFYDLSLRTLERPAPQDIVIVAIDEPSLQALGQWPWSRRVHAELLDRLSQAGVRAVGWDIAFTEPEHTDPKADSLLAAAIARNGKVVLPVAPEQAALGEPLRESHPLVALEQAAARLGHVDVELDTDGVAREIFLRAGLGYARWPNISLAMLDIADPDAWKTLPGQRPPQGSANASHAWVRDYALRPTFIGPPGQVPRLPYVDVLRQDALLRSLQGKFVLIGMTAQGLSSPLMTPMTRARQPMLGVEFHANVLDSLRSHSWIQPLSALWQIGLLSLLAALPVLLFARLSPRGALVCTAGLLLGIGLLSLSLLHLGWWFAPAANLLGVAISYPLWSWRRLERAGNELRQQHERARATLRSIADAVVSCDAVGRIAYMNPSAETMSGWPELEARGRLFSEVFADADASVEYSAAAPISANHAQTRHLRRRDGAPYAVRMVANRVEANAAGGSLVVTMSDITENLANARRLQYQATHDALTGLPNRVLLADRIQQAILTAQRSGSVFALVFIDLDGFKRINDSLGHARGDDLLCAVAARLSVGGRSNDTVARWGGDEFVLLIEGLQREESIVQIPRKLIRRFEEPFMIGGHEIFMTSSVGISVYPRDGDEAETLLQHADGAMYRVKQSGRNDFRFHAEATHQSSRAQLELERDLHHALHRSEFLLHFQAQRQVTSGALIGAECLIRWQHPSEGLLPPAPFIPIAEQSDLIHQIDEWVLRTACSTMKEWQRQNLPAVGLSVNLSARQFHRRGLVDAVKAILTETGISPALITLELTETLVMQDVERAAETLHNLNQLGVKISVDDFGTGYSSLAYLKRFPIDEIKIDQSFVRDLTWDNDDAAIIHAVISLAHSLGIEVTAEGVETREQLRYLREHGCDHVQGYYCGRPVANSEFAHLLRHDSQASLIGAAGVAGMFSWPDDHNGALDRPPLH